MSFEQIGVGSFAGDGTGDTLRDAFIKINNNFSQIEDGNIELTVNSPVQSVSGRTGNVVLTVNDVAGAVSSGVVTSLIVEQFTDQGIASESYVISAIDSAIDNLIGGAPTTLDTLREISNSLANNSSLSTTLTNSISGLRSNITAANLNIDSLSTLVNSHASSILSLSSTVGAHTNLIADKVDTESLAVVAFTGEYADLIDLPSIPTVPENVSEFTNDAGYLVLANISGKADSSSLANVALTGSYEDLIDVPTNISSFTNDSGYLVLANISGKADSSSLANVALTGSYEDLIDAPTIPTVPTNISSFTNDAGYLVLANISGKADSSSLANVALTGSYDDLTNTPTIPTVPTNVSEFTNDAGYLVLANISGKADSSSLANVALTGSYEDLIDVPTNISSFTNDAGYAVESNVNLTITELGNTLSNSIGNIQSNVSTIDSTLGTLNNTVSGIITALDEGPIDVTGNISATNIFTDNLFYANGDPYITSGVSDTGNIRFSGDTITNAENEEDRGIILNASGNGEISLTDNTGINNLTPGYWLHVGSEETTTGNINTGEIAISFSNGQSGVGAYNNTAYLGWNWWDSASQGSFNNGTGVHSKFGIYSGNSSPYSQPFIEFDGNSGDVSVPNSLSILGNFLKLPTFDNSTSRDTLIPTPEAGMMILTGNIFQGYNGSSWVDLNN